MSKKILLALALTLTVTSLASAAPKRDRWMDAQNQSVTQHADDVLFERAKGGIEY